MDAEVTSPEEAPTVEMEYVARSSRLFSSFPSSNLQYSCSEASAERVMQSKPRGSVSCASDDDEAAKTVRS